MSIMVTYSLLIVVILAFSSSLVYVGMRDSELSNHVSEESG